MNSNCSLETLSKSAPYSSPWADHRCLETTEALIVDGANGVCSNQRHPELWPNSMLLFVFIGSIVLTIFLLKQKRLGRGTALSSLCFVALLSFSQGMWSILAVRADSPPKVGETSERYLKLSNQLKVFFDNSRSFRFEDGCIECWAAILFVSQGVFPNCQVQGNEKICSFSSSFSAETEIPFLRLYQNAIHGCCQWNNSNLTCGDSNL